ncbi:MAG: phenol hydroxylase subunit P4 [Halioglobus sp.]|nr:phenol hydroxylase subunit P4 [Halioglobus sp.]
MAVSAITDDYTGERLDRVENFNGNQLVYVGWDRHLLFCAPVAFLLPPDLPFSTLLEETIPGAFSLHPEFAQIDWQGVEWLLDDEAFTPDPGKSIAEQGVGHKSIIRFATPGLDGIQGSGS